MSVIAERQRTTLRRVVPPPPLENGDRLGLAEFLRRYEGNAELKKAELIEGIVCMPSPVSAEHARPDNLLQTWLGLYSAATPGVECYANATTLLGPRNVAQPDACLCLTPQAGGRVRLSDRQYLVGAPELVVEIATSSVSIDLGDKKEAYATSGVGEYVVWRTQESALDWFVLEDADYLAVAPDGRGVIHSRRFPGLTLHVPSLLALHRAKVLSHLQRGLSSTAHRVFVRSLR